MAKSWLIVHPAYGRTYATSELLRAAWDGGKDFKIEGGPYLSNRDVEHNTAGLREKWTGIQIVQKRVAFELADGRMCRVPFLTEEIRW